MAICLSSEQIRQGGENEPPPRSVDRKALPVRGGADQGESAGCGPEYQQVVGNGGNVPVHDQLHRTRETGADHRDAFPHRDGVGDGTRGVDSRRVQALRHCTVTEYGERAGSRWSGASQRFSRVRESGAPDKVSPCRPSAGASKAARV